MASADGAPVTQPPWRLAMLVQQDAAPNGDMLVLASCGCSIPTARGTGPVSLFP
jgi:hypothetical protein